MVDEATLEQWADAARRICAGTSYRPMRFLGCGGLGHVWVVRQETLRKEFALKLLHRRLGARPGDVDRLRIEAQATARIEHPAIVNVIDFLQNGEDNAGYVMELLRGRPLSEVIRVGFKLSVRDVLDLGCQLLSALGAAHALGVIHRDVKPSNLFLHERQGQTPILKVLDFGIAYIIENHSVRTPAPPSIRTATGAAMGSPRYMSPEAAMGRRVDARSDIYCVGLILYEALTGRGPMDLCEPEEVLPPSQLAPGISAELDEHLLRAIKTDPNERFQTAAEFETALRSLAYPTAFRARANSAPRFIALK